MRSMLFFAVVLAVGSIPGWVTCQETVYTAEDFANGSVAKSPGSGEQTFWIRINKDLPPYKFRLIPDASLKDSPGADNPSHRVGSIEISTGSPRRVVQNIQIDTQAGVDTFKQYFTAQDVNMDGYADIAVTDDFGAKWGRQKFWLFDKKKGRFITNTLTNDIYRFKHNGIETHPQMREIDFNYLPIIGVGGVIKETYRVGGGRLTFVKLEEIQNTAKGSRILVKKRVNGRLRTVMVKKQMET